MSTTPYLVEICRLLLGLTLLAAAIGKIANFKQFSSDLSDSLKLSTRWSQPLTSLLIISELLLSILILLNKYYEYMAMAMAAILLSSFTLYIVVSLLQNKLIRCNCFGQSNDSISYFDVSRNLVLIIAAIFYLLNQQAMAINTLSQFLLGFVALSILLIITHLQELALLTRNPKAS